MKQLSSVINRIDIHRLPEVAALLFAGLMLGFFPLALISDYGTLTRGKFLILAFMCCDMLAALLLALLWTRRIRQPLLPAVRDWLPAQKLLPLFWLLALISALASPYPDLTLLGSGRWDGLAALTMYVFITLSLAAFGRWQDGLFDLTAVSSLLLSGICLWQLAGGNPLGLYPAGLTYADGGHLYAGRFLGTVGNVDMLSAYWCLILPLLLGGVLLLPGRRRWLAAAALLLGCGVEAAADVSSGPLALVLSSLLLGPLLLTGRPRYLAYLASALLLGAAVLALYLYQGPEQGTLWELSRVLHGDLREEFGSSRILIWQEAWASRGQGWQQLLGSGPGTRITHFSTVFERLDESGATLRAAVDSSHNEYLDQLLELGAAGLLVYVAALTATAVSFLKSPGRCDRRTVILAWSITAYCLQALFNFSSVVISPLFWALWGLLLARLRGPAPPLLREEGAK